MTQRSVGEKGSVSRRIGKMRENTTTGAEVRRDFRRVRPLKADVPFPLHADVVWRIANQAIAEFRGRLEKAGLINQDVHAWIVYVRSTADGTRPHFLPLEDEGEPQELKAAVNEALSKEGNLAIGMVFDHFDPTGGTDGMAALAVFPYQFRGLSEEGVLQLRFACVAHQSARKALATGN